MKNIKFIFLLGLLFTIASCSPDSEGEIISPELEVTDAVKSKLVSLSFNEHDVETTEVTLPDGSSEMNYLVEGDIVMSPDALFNMDLHGGITTDQYRTFNLVNNNRTIRVIGYTGGGGYGLSSKMRTALQWAVNNYNRINTGLNFTLTYGTNYNSYDIVVYRVPNGQAGGQAGFPSGGNPYKWVQIFSGMDAYNTNVNEHVMTHEIGHSVGLRHTDWFNRASCGQNSNEGSGSTGAVHIPGTPTGYDSTSIMLACFNGGTNGEFNANDRRALEYLY